MQALVIAAHGSHLNPDASDPTYAHADTIRETGAFDEVREAFWKEEPHFREVIRTLESDEVFVVPLFISEGYFTWNRSSRGNFASRSGIPTGGESDGTSASQATLEAEDVGKTIHCGPVGTHDAMTDVIVQRAETATENPDVGEGFGLSVVGHGTDRNENSAKAIKYHSDRIAERDRFDEVKALFMDEDPEVDDVTDYFESDDVVVAPLHRRRLPHAGRHSRRYGADRGLSTRVGRAERGRRTPDLVPAPSAPRICWPTSSSSGRPTPEPISGTRARRSANSPRRSQGPRPIPTNRTPGGARGLDA